MQYINLQEPIDIIGVKIKTTNDKGVAFKDIPAQWQKVFQEKLLEKIPNKTSDDIYAIYTDFENAGENNQGIYSFIIGAPVSSLKEIPEGYTGVTIRSAPYQIFSVEKGHPEKVGEKWQEIWNFPFERKQSFILDFERYKSNGDIDIFVGLK